MFERTIEIVVIVAEVYLLLGVIFAAFLHFLGLTRLDPATRGAGIFFRILITPGLVVLWPVMLMKWTRRIRGFEPYGDTEAPVSPRKLRRAHGLLIQAVAVLAPIAAAFALASRPTEMSTSSQPLFRDESKLSRIVSETTAPFPKLPIHLTVKSNGSQRQFELRTDHDLEIPALGLFLCHEQPGEKLPRGAAFLGSVWGPSTKYYDVPTDFPPSHGFLALYSLAKSEVIAAAPAPAAVWGE